MRQNFDLSPSSYGQFEGRFGLFGQLTRHLAELARVGAGDRLVDMGCGTGDSTVVLEAMVGSGGLVLGLDISAGMLGPAVSRGLIVVQADAGAPPLREGPVFDAVLYNACAFLLPRPGVSFSRATRLLVPGGCVAASVLWGLVEARTGEDLASRHGVRCGPVVQPGRVREALEEAVGPVDSSFVMRIEPGEPRAFYGIPAQSAALFPGRSVERRRDLVRSLFDEIESAGSTPALRWEHLVARAGGR